jgi:hypothetical protein
MPDVADPKSSGDVTLLFGPALAGDRPAQDQLFRLIKPEARKLAIRWLRKFASVDRVGVTELIGAAFVRLVPPPKSDAHRPEPWPHRGLFYALLCRNICQALIDMLRGAGGFTNSKALPALLSEALQGDEAILKSFADTGGDPAKLSKMLSDLIWSDHMVPRILQEGGEPSAVQRALHDLLDRAETRQALAAAGGDPEKLRSLTVGVLHLKPTPKGLLVYRSVPQEGPTDTANGASTPMGLAEHPAEPRGLTQNSIITLHNALEELDQVYAHVPAAPLPPLPGCRPRQSSHAQIIDMRLFGEFAWDEIAAFLELPRGTVVARKDVACEWLRDRLNDSFSGILNELQPVEA